MGLSSVAVLSLLVVQALSAPSGCTESCTSYHRTYQTQTASGYQDHAGLIQARPTLDDLSYAKPGNWSELNHFKTDGGRGNVHEERGQYVDGPKRVRYYKKNYTSSYSTNHAAGTGQSELELLNQNRYGSVYPTSQQLLDSQRTYGQIGNVQTSSQQQEYNRIHSQRAESLSTRTAGQSERLEDFGEYNGNSQVSQHDVSRVNSQSSRGQHTDNRLPSNWSRVDSYRTDGGHGRVYEEEGQYVTGPKNVRYFKRNYTSSYSTGGIPVTSEIRNTGVHDVHREIENLQRVLDREIQQISSTAHRQSNVLQSHTDTLGIAGSSLQTTGGADYRLQPSGVISSVHQNQEEQISSTSHGSTARLPYVRPTQRVYSTESHRNSYERHEEHVPQVQTEHYYQNPTAAYSQVLTNGNTAFVGGTRNVEREHRVSEHANLHQSELVNAHQSLNAENHFGADNLEQIAYNQRIASRPTVPSRAGHYREEWSAASHTRESTFPHTINTGAQHVDQENTRYTDHQNILTSLGHASYRDQLRQNKFNSGLRTSSGPVTTGILDMGQVGHTADCGHDAEQIQYNPQYHRNYKRSVDYNEQDDMQQRQKENLAQQVEDLTQQLEQQHDNGFDSTNGKLEFGQQSQYPEDDDLTQQTTGKLEFGQQREYPYQFSEPKDRQQQQQVDITGQTAGQLQFTQQNEDLTQQTSGPQDFFHHSANPVNFGRQRQSPSSKPAKPELDFAEEHNSQTSGKLEFGQQIQQTRPKLTVGNQHLEKLDQENEDLTQQTSGFEDHDRTRGKLEFGQQFQEIPPVGSHHLDDFSQQNEDLVQQTSGFDNDHATRGKLEFGQQSRDFQRKPVIGNQHLEDLTDQNEDLTQQTSGFDDYDRTHGRLEFGQQTQTGWDQRRHNQNIDSTQQNEDLAQVSSGHTDFRVPNLQSNSQIQQQSRYPYQPQKPISGQESMGALEFGQDSQYPWRVTPEKQHADVSTSGKLEFGEQSMDHHRQNDFTQQNEDLTQQTGGFDDFTPQASGKLEFGQQTQQFQHTWRPATGNQHLEDFTQHTGEFRDHTQQTPGKLEISQQTQNQFQPWGQFTDLTQKNEDSVDQAAGTLEFGQYRPIQPSGSHGNSHNNAEDLTQGQLQFGSQDSYLNSYQQNVEQTDKYRVNWERPKNLQEEGLEQQSGSFNYVQKPSNVDQSYQNNYKQELEPFYLMSHTTEEPSGVIPLEQEINHDKPLPTTGLKPAEKPKPRPRYSKPVVIDPTNTPQKQDYPHLPNITPEVDTDDIRIGNLRGDQDDNVDSTDENLNKQSRVSGFERSNADQVGWLHKSNDATVGLQWHYTYHPSDLTNSEPVQNGYYPSHRYHSGMQPKESTGQTEPQINQDKPSLILDQETKPFEFNPSEAQNKPASDNMYGRPSYGQSSYPQQHLANNQDSSVNQETNQYPTSQNVGPIQDRREPGVKGGRRRQQIQNAAAEPKLEPRIIEAYGGGPYDGSHSEDIYSRAPLNPSATLPPLSGEDPWDIREKPNEPFGTTIVAEIIPETVTESIDSMEGTPEPPPPSFWRRLGHKITNTFDKARDKARGIFG